MGLGHDPSAVSRMETGTRSIQVEEMARAAEVLRVSAEYLAGVSVSDGVRDLPGIRWVEVRGLAAAAGGGAAVLGEEVEGYLAFRREWLANHGIDPTQCVVIDVTGDSMEPTLPEGSAILVDRAQRRRRAGRIYVIRSEDDLLVKRALQQRQGWVMASDNLAHDPVRWPVGAEIIGEVRWVARSLRDEKRLSAKRGRST